MSTSAVRDKTLRPNLMGFARTIERVILKLDLLERRMVLTKKPIFIAACAVLTGAESFADATE